MRLFAKITSAVSALAMLAGMAVVPASADTAVREVKLELTEVNVVGRYSNTGEAMSTPANTAALFDGATDGIVEFGTQQFLYIDLGEPTAISKLVLKTDETGMSIRKSAYGAAMAAVTNELPNAANPRDTVLDAARNNDRAVNGVEVISMSEPVEVQGSDYETEGAGTFYPEKVVGPVTPDG